MFSPREMEGKDIVGAGMHFSDVENSSSGNEIFCVEMHWNIFPPSQISIYQQEDEEAPIYRSPNILFCSFWKNEVLIKPGFVWHTMVKQIDWKICDYHVSCLKRKQAKKPTLLSLF